MRAKEFLKEETSNLSYIARFIEREWPMLGVPHGCLASAVLFSVAQDLDLNLKRTFEGVAAIVKRKNYNMSSLPQLIKVLEEENELVKNNGQHIYCCIKMFEPSLAETIGLIKADHPVVIIFDSSDTSPIMNDIVNRERVEASIGNWWSGITRPDPEDFEGYEYPPKPGQKLSPAGHMGIVREGNHAMLVVGYDAGEKVLVCRDNNPLKGLKGYLKIPTDLIKYTKLFAFKATQS